MIASDAWQMWSAVLLGMLTAIFVLLIYYVSQTLRYRSHIWGFFIFQGFAIGIITIIMRLFMLYIDEYAVVSESRKDSALIVYGVLSIGLFFVLLYPVSIVGKRLGHFDQAELDRQTKSPRDRRDILSKYGVKDKEGKGKQ